jgi:hypothetical protein
MTAEQKQRVLRAWQRFVDSGFERQQFTRALYNHLILHCSFIAHYDVNGFYAEYFEDSTQTQRFLGQFDRRQGCVSIEMGHTLWLSGDYSDINNAMVDAIADDLVSIRQRLWKTPAVEDAQAAGSDTGQEDSQPTDKPQ